MQNNNSATSKKVVEINLFASPEEQDNEYNLTVVAQQHTSLQATISAPDHRTGSKKPKRFIKRLKKSVKIYAMKRKNNRIVDPDTATSHVSDEHSTCKQTVQDSNPVTRVDENANFKVCPGCNSAPYSQIVVGNKVLERHSCVMKGAPYHLKFPAGKAIDYAYVASNSEIDAVRGACGGVGNIEVAIDLCEASIKNGSGNGNIGNFDNGLAFVKSVAKKKQFAGQFCTETEAEIPFIDDDACDDATGKSTETINVVLDRSCREAWSRGSRKLQATKPMSKSSQKRHNQVQKRPAITKDKAGTALQNGVALNTSSHSEQTGEEHCAVLGAPDSQRVAMAAPNSKSHVLDKDHLAVSVNRDLKKCDARVEAENVCFEACKRGFSHSPCVAFDSVSHEHCAYDPGEQTVADNTEICAAKKNEDTLNDVEEQTASKEQIETRSSEPEDKKSKSCEDTENTVVIQSTDNDICSQRSPEDACGIVIYSHASSQGTGNVVEVLPASSGTSDPGLPECGKETTFYGMTIDQHSENTVDELLADKEACSPGVLEDCAKGATICAVTNTDKHLPSEGKTSEFSSSSASVNSHMQSSVEHSRSEELFTHTGFSSLLEKSMFVKTPNANEVKHPGERNDGGLQEHGGNSIDENVVDGYMFSDSRPRSGNSNHHIPEIVTATLSEQDVSLEGQNTETVMRPSLCMNIDPVDKQGNGRQGAKGQTKTKTYMVQRDKQADSHRRKRSMSDPKESSIRKKNSKKRVERREGHGVEMHESVPDGSDEGHGLGEKRQKNLQKVSTCESDVPKTTMPQVADSNDLHFLCPKNLPIALTNDLVLSAEDGVECGYSSVWHNDRGGHTTMKKCANEMTMCGSKSMSCGMTHDVQTYEESDNNKLIRDEKIKAIGDNQCIVCKSLENERRVEEVKKVEKQDAGAGSAHEESVPDAVGELSNTLCNVIPAGTPKLNLQPLQNLASYQNIVGVGIAIHQLNLPSVLKCENQVSTMRVDGTYPNECFKDDCYARDHMSSHSDGASLSELTAFTSTKMQSKASEVLTDMCTTGATTFEMPNAEPYTAATFPEPALLQKDMCDNTKGNVTRELNQVPTLEPVFSVQSYNPGIPPLQDMDMEVNEMTRQTSAPHLDSKLHLPDYAMNQTGDIWQHSSQFLHPNTQTSGCSGPTFHSHSLMLDLSLTVPPNTDGTIRSFKDTMESDMVDEDDGDGIYDDKYSVFSDKHLQLQSSFDPNVPTHLSAFIEDDHAFGTPKDRLVFYDDKSVMNSHRKDLLTRSGSWPKSAKRKIAVPRESVPEIA